MEYQLWDTDAGSYIGKYTDETAALSIVKILVDRYGQDYAESLSLGRIADDGNILPALSGQELYERAYGEKTEDERRPTFIGPKSDACP